VTSLRRLPLVFLLLTAACRQSNQAPRAQATPVSPLSFDEWADAFTLEWARNSPQLATWTQYFAGDEQDALDGQLSLVGEWGDLFGAAAGRNRAALAARGLEQLRRFERDGLTPQQQLSAAVLEWSLDDAVKNAKFASYTYVFEHDEDK
jgi:uncharacterized protein (DUF885 family)